MVPIYTFVSLHFYDIGKFIYLFKLNMNNNCSIRIEVEF